MRCDVGKLKAARDRRAMTQEKLAAEARCDIRTIQRAEAGFSLRQETVADIAAVLGMPLSNLVDTNPVSEPEDNASAGGFGNSISIKRVIVGREVIELMERCSLGKLECDVDPTPENMAALKAAIYFLEALILDPWEKESLAGITFCSLVDRLEHIASMNSILETLERDGLGLFMGSSWLNAVMPYCGEEGMCVSRTQHADSVRAARLLISARSGDRAVISTDVKWPVEIRDDDDIPF